MWQRHFPKWGSSSQKTQLITREQPGHQHIKLASVITHTHTIYHHNAVQHHNTIQHHNRHIFLAPFTFNMNHLAIPLFKQNSLSSCPPCTSTHKHTHTHHSEDWIFITLGLKSSLAFTYILFIMVLVYGVYGEARGGQRHTLGHQFCPFSFTWVPGMAWKSGCQACLASALMSHQITWLILNYLMKELFTDWPWKPVSIIGLIWNSCLVLIYPIEHW